MKQPECLHIPILHEGKTAEISWGTVETNINYIIERVYNETFFQAASGYTWDNIKSADEAWSKYDQDNLNWNQIESKANKGRTWDNLDYEAITWQELEKQSRTWKQLDNRATSFEIFSGHGTERTGIEQGCAWLELDSLAESWSSLEATGRSWAEWELLTKPGLSWDSIEARWRNWTEWEEKGLTFHELDIQEPQTEHLGMTDDIPIGAQSAMYQIKTDDANGNTSGYLTTSQLPVIPIFFRRCEMEYPVNTGRRYRVLLKGQDIYDLDKVRMNLRYNPYLLEMTNFAAHSEKTIVNPGDYPSEQLNIYCHEPGKVWFQSTKPIAENEAFSGLITLIEFIARGTGTAMISLS